jgi:hypothetical protein
LGDTNVITTMIYRHVLMPEDTKFNQRTKVLPGKEKARCFWKTTLSKKGRGVKMLE